MKTIDQTTPPPRKTTNVQPKSRGRSLKVTVPEGLHFLLEETATDRGFQTVEDFVIYSLTAVSWPGDRISVITGSESFKRWNSASLAAGLPFMDWIRQTLDEASAAAVGSSTQKGGRR